MLRAQRSSSITSEFVRRWSHTLVHANAVRDWRIYARFRPELSLSPASVCAGTFGVELRETSMRSTHNIDLCLSVFPWAVPLAKRPSS